MIDEFVKMIKEIRIIMKGKESQVKCLRED
jgi:hypothetical protein